MSSGFIDYPPLAGNELKFNPANFKSGSDFITLADADKRYFKISGGAITGSVYIGGNLDINTWSLSGTTISLTATQLNYLNVTAGSAVASKALVLDDSNNISGIGSMSLSSLSISSSGVNQLTITGTAASQRSNLIFVTDNQSLELGVRGSAAPSNPNQMYIYFNGGYRLLMNNSGALSIMSSEAATSTSTGALRINGGALVKAASWFNADITLAGNLNFNGASRSITGLSTLTATSLAGTLTTAAQPNITSVGTLNRLSAIALTTANGSILAKYTSTLPNPSDYCSQSALTIYQYSATLGYAASIAFLVSTNDSAATIAGSRIDAVRTGSGGVSDLVFSCRNDLASCNERLRITSAGNVGINTSTPGSALDVAGTVTMTTLKIGSTIVLATADQLNFNVVTPGTALASRSLVLDGSSSISGIVSLTATNLSGTNVYGLIKTNAQPLIRSVATLDITDHDGTTQGLKLGGALVTASASELNYVDVVPGTAAQNKALVCDFDNNIQNINELWALNLYGTLGTADQPNITSLGTLTSLAVSGSVSYTSTTDSTSSTTGAFVTAGGIGVAKSLFAGTSLNSPILNLSSTTDSTSSSTGSFITAGGIGVAKSLFVGATTNTLSLVISGTTASTSETTGALQVAGGIGIGGDSYFKNQVTIGDTGSLILSNTLAGALKILRSASSVSMRIGSAESTGNCCTLQWVYVGSNSATNRLRFDFFGGTDTLVISNNNRIGIATSAPICRLDLGATAGDRILSLFSNATDFYGIGANSTTVYYQSAATHAWYYASTPSSKGSLAMTLNNSNRLGVGLSTPEGSIHAVGQIWTNDLFHSKVNSDSPIFTWRNSTVNYTAIGTYLNNTASIRLGTVNGSFAWVGYSPVYGGSYTNASDQRLKRDIVDIPYGLDEVMQLLPRRFVWKDSGLQSIGFIAQEMLPILPEPVSVPANCDDLNEDGTPRNGMGIDYACLTSLLCKAIQELKQKIDSLEQRLSQL